MNAPAGLQQLPLAFTLNERLDFNLFVAGDNAAVCGRLQELAAEGRGQVYLWGAPGSGRSHLLQATCQLAGQHQLRAAYVPLAQFAAHGPGLLEGLEGLDLVALDDLQTVAGQDDWEQALFGLYNSLRDAGRAFVAAADSSPRGLALELADLRSRLGWGEVFHLQPLADDDKREALVRRASARGIELPDEVAVYLLRRTVRDMAGLMAWLDHLDQAQLAAQRRLSIPFVKSLLQESAPPGPGAD
ncbi:DnaA family protein [Methylohalomonas lacus]|uniref:DnaA family protein n=1 Tax=Methylohalomonas lacus TaxID=398773 RepID=A0AAE3HKB7_9GAMM|nr:DnaA regulatory inactivator Hda [Methylohalomonas lacus]MCS3903891.1 DnaA family protein [Methylohalomonas lacus]